MWKKENDVGTQPTPTMATYSEAMDKFTKSATAFMEHVHHLTQARDAYQEAMTVSTAIRNSLDAGDQALRSLLLQLEQRSEEHTSELQSRLHLVCRLLLEKKKKHTYKAISDARDL